LLDVARNDLNSDNRVLVDRLRAVNNRAIDLTEALLLLSRADQRSFTREHVDLSLIAEEATETLLPLAEKRGLTIETSGDATPTIGSQALLLQLSTNLVHNAIVHNLPEQGSVWVTTSVQPKSAVLTVETSMLNVLPINTMAIALGLHVRCGIEDNLWNQSRTAKVTTVQQIEQLVRISREFGREVANGKEAREICKIGVFYETVEETLAANGFAPNPKGGHQGHLRKAAA